MSCEVEQHQCQLWTRFNAGAIDGPFNVGASGYMPDGLSLFLRSYNSRSTDPGYQAATGGPATTGADWGMAVNDFLVAQRDWVGTGVIAWDDDFDTWVGPDTPPTCGAINNGDGIYGFPDYDFSWGEQQVSDTDSLRRIIAHGDVAPDYSLFGARAGLNRGGNPQDAERRSHLGGSYLGKVGLMGSNEVSSPEDQRTLACKLRVQIDEYTWYVLLNESVVPGPFNTGWNAIPLITWINGAIPGEQEICSIALIPSGGQLRFGYTTAVGLGGPWTHWCDIAGGCGRQIECECTATNPDPITEARHRTWYFNSWRFLNLASTYTLLPNSPVVLPFTWYEVEARVRGRTTVVPGTCQPDPLPAPYRITEGVLECGRYEAKVLERGGQRVVHDLPYTSLEWGRVLDDTSEALLTIQGLSGRGNCCAKIADVRPWKHELGLYRNGELVWVGPITKPKVDNAADVATIAARDVTAWWDKRFIHKDHDYGIVDLAYLFAVFIDDAMTPDNSPGIHVIASQAQILGEHKVLANDHRIAGPEIRALSEIGVDWTTIRRDVLAGGVVVPLTELPAMIDEHFVVPPAVSLDGLNQENHVGVRGNGVGAAGDAVYGDAEDASSASVNGLLEGIVTQDSAGTGIAAAAAAQTKLATVAEALAVIETGVLAYDSPFPIDTLVPGSVVPVRLQDTCYPVMGYFRIGAIGVVASASEGDVTETVTVSFMPLGTTFTPHHYPPRLIYTPGSVG